MLANFKETLNIYIFSTEFYFQKLYLNILYSVHAWEFLFTRWLNNIWLEVCWVYIPRRLADGLPTEFVGSVLCYSAAPHKHTLQPQIGNNFFHF